MFALTEPEGILRVYLDEGELMEQALQALRDEPSQAPALSLSSVSALLTAFEQEKQKRAQKAALSFASPQAEQNASALTQPPLLESLSPHERRVLHLLVAGRTNPEIASDLVVSVNTVKTHIQHIYRKLGVTNRMAASVAAHDLRLL